MTIPKFTTDGALDPTEAAAPYVMMTAAEYRASAEQMDSAAEDAGLSEAIAVEFRNMAIAWRKLAKLADWQEAMALEGHSSS